MITKRSTKLLALSAAAALALSACSAGSNTASDDNAGEGLPVGASMEEFHEALADMEPVTLNMQVSSANATSLSGQRDVAFAESIKEWSDGKITVELSFANAIVPPNDIADALGDGRLDLAHWLTSYHVDEMPAFVNLQDALTVIPSSPLQGEIINHFTAQEVAFNTPEIMEEFDRQGMTVLNPLNTFGATVLACNEEKESKANFNGSQIRANAAAQVKQAESLGASALSLQLAETYEGLQRNLIQCTFGSPTTMVSNSWLEQAGNVYIPKESSFIIGPGSIVAGASWDNLPLAAQQLIFDRTVEYNIGELGQSYVSLHQAIKVASEKGSGMHYLSPELDEALAEGNEGILESVRESPLLDGEKLIADVEASAEKWAGIAEELGYTNDGDFLEFPDWYQGNGEVMDTEYLTPIVERFYEEVLMANRPE